MRDPSSSRRAGMTWGWLYWFLPAGVGVVIANVAYRAIAGLSETDVRWDVIVGYLNALAVSVPLVGFIALAMRAAALITRPRLSRARPQAAIWSAVRLRLTRFDFARLGITKTSDPALSLYFFIVWDESGLEFWRSVPNHVRLLAASWVDVEAVEPEDLRDDYGRRRRGVRIRLKVGEKDASLRICMVGRGFVGFLPQNETVTEAVVADMQSRIQRARRDSAR